MRLVPIFVTFVKMEFVVIAKMDFLSLTISVSILVGKAFILIAIINAKNVMNLAILVLIINVLNVKMRDSLFIQIVNCVYNLAR